MAYNIWCACGARLKTNDERRAAMCRECELEESQKISMRPKKVQERNKMFNLHEGERLVPNVDGTVTLITQTGQEHTYDPEDFKSDVQVFDLLMQYEMPETPEVWRAMQPVEGASWVTISRD